MKDPTLGRSLDNIEARRGSAFVLIGPAGGPAHRDASVRLRRKDWEVVVGLIPGWDLDPSADPVVFGREPAARLAAELRAAFGRCPAGGKRAAEQLLAVLREGQGLLVSGVVA